MPEHAEVAPARATSRRRRFVAALAPLLAALLLVTLIVGLFGARLFDRRLFGGPPAFALPSGWHDITAPISETIASYAASPDVPGLILACIGEKAGRLSADPMGPAHLWRTRDGGAHWERLSAPALTAGCEVAAPIGGRGTFFVFDALTREQAIWGSHDAGDAWAALVPTALAALGGAQSLFAALARGTYRDGKFYTYSEGERAAFAVSPDDGRTWVNLETGQDAPLQRGLAPRGLVPDYRASGAWFRLVARAVAQAGTPGESPMLERSANNGRTWTRLAALGSPVGLLQGNTTTLATSPAHPARLCVAFAAMPGASPTSSRMIAAAKRAPLPGPPSPEPLDIALFGSDDGGQTFAGGVVARHRRDYGGLVPGGVMMGPDGGCSLMESSADLETETETLWRLAAGASSPAPGGRLSGMAVSRLMIAPGDRTNSARLIVLAEMAERFERNICSADAACYDPPRQTPHLIWTAIR